MQPRTRTSAADAASRRDRRATQRERLLGAMIATANRDGFARASVSAVIRQAGVSRPTFYEYFADRDACFLAALAELHEQLLAMIEAAVTRDPPECALDAAVAAVLEFALAHPAAARFLLNEPLAAGTAALDARDRGIGEIAALVERTRRQAPPAAVSPDVSSCAVLGGVFRLLGARLRRGDPGSSVLRGELLDWLAGYARPAAEHCWQSLASLPAPASSPFVQEPPLRAPLPLPPGRPRLSPEEVLRTHRQGILFAAAVLAASKGYAATTVADIARIAGVDSRAFYRSFADKQDAFMAVHELGFQQTMAVVAGAFFAGASWPERSWEAARAFMQFLEKNPAIAHFGFVEAYAVGPGAVQRVEDSYIAFTIFLQEGYQHTRRDPPPSRVALEAIITTIFEGVYLRARASRRPRLAPLLAHMSFLWLAPFLGPQAALEFITVKLSTPA
jgi:AcrR family transcriptional regulator